MKHQFWFAQAGSADNSCLFGFTIFLTNKALGMFMCYDTLSL